MWLFANVMGLKSPLLLVERKMERPKGPLCEACLILVCIRRNVYYDCYVNDLKSRLSGRQHKLSSYKPFITDHRHESRKH